MRKACLRNRNLSYVNTYNRPEGGSRDRTFSNYPFRSNILCCLLWAHLTSKCVPASGVSFVHICLTTVSYNTLFINVKKCIQFSTPRFSSKNSVFFMYTLVLHCLLSSCNIGQFILPVLLCKFAACLVLPLSLQLKSQSWSKERFSFYY